MNLIAFGLTTVSNLINSDFFEFKRIIILEEKKTEYSQLAKNLTTKQIIHEFVDKEEFGRHIPDRKHQGIIAFIKDYHYSSLSSLVRKKANHGQPLLIMLDSIEDPHNFGAILRTCAAMNVDGVIISSRQQVQITSAVIKVSTGGISYLPVCRVSSLEEALNNLKLAGYQLISTVCSDEKDVIDYRKIVFQQPTCLIFGNEHEGIKNRIIRKSDCLVSIPLANKMNSLNVSVSCGIIIASLRS